MPRSNAVVSFEQDVGCATNGNRMLEVVRRFHVEGIESRSAAEAIVAVHEQVAVPWSVYPVQIGDINFGAIMYAVGFTVSDMSVSTAKVDVRYINPTNINIIGSSTIECLQTDMNIYGDPVVVSNVGLAKTLLDTTQDRASGQVWTENDHIKQMGVYQGSFSVGTFLIELIRPNGAPPEMGGPRWGQFPLISMPSNAVDPNVIRDTYVNRCNSATFLGRPVGSVACDAIEISNDGFGDIANYIRFHFSIRYAPRKWTEIVSYRDPATGQIPYPVNWGPLNDYDTNAGSYNNPPSNRFEVSTRLPIDFNAIFTPSMVPQ